MSIFRHALALGALAALPLAAHHELRAEFDDQKPVSLRGIVTRFEWNNPHAFVYVDVAGPGGDNVNWAVEWASPLQLRKAGWSRDALKVGDSVTVEGWLARDGSKLASGRTIVLASGRRLADAPETEAAPARDSAKSKPTPRWPDGHPRLGVVPGGERLLVESERGQPHRYDRRQYTHGQGRAAGESR